MRTFETALTLLATLVVAVRGQLVSTITQYPSTCSAIYTSGGQTITFVQSTVTATVTPTTSSISDGAANSGTPFVLELEQPTPFGKRQVATRFWLKSNGNTTSDGTQAARFVINSGQLQLLSGGSYSTAPGITQQPFAVTSTAGSINTTFTSSSGTLTWSNGAFTPGGLAQFYKTPIAAVDNSQVIVVFSDLGSNAPASWAPVRLGIRATTDAVPLATASASFSVVTSIIGFSSMPVFTFAPTTITDSISTSSNAAGLSTSTPPALTLSTISAPGIPIGPNRPSGLSLNATIVTSTSSIPFTSTVTLISASTSSSGAATTTTTSTITTSTSVTTSIFTTFTPILSTTSNPTSSSAVAPSSTSSAVASSAETSISSSSSSSSLSSFVSSSSIMSTTSLIVPSTTSVQLQPTSTTAQSSSALTTSSSSLSSSIPSGSQVASTSSSIPSTTTSSSSSVVVSSTTSTSSTVVFSTTSTTSTSSSSRILLSTSSPSSSSSMFTTTTTSTSTTTITTVTTTTTSRSSSSSSLPFSTTISTSSSSSGYLTLASPTPCDFGDPAGTPEDDSFCEIDLPFQMTMYSVTAPTTFASTNGFISMIEGSSQFQVNPLPFDGIPSTTIAPYFADLYINGTGSPAQGVFYQADSTGITYEYYLVNSAVRTSLYHFTVRYDTARPGIFTYNYISAPNAGSDASIGSQGLDASGNAIASQYSFLDNVITAGLRVVCNTNPAVNSCQAA